MTSSRGSQRPSEYQRPVFMHEVPEHAQEEAEQMARRHGVRGARTPPRRSPTPKAPPSSPHGGSSQS